MSWRQTQSQRADLPCWRQTEGGGGEGGGEKKARLQLLCVGKAPFPVLQGRDVAKVSVQPAARWLLPLAELLQEQLSGSCFCTTSPGRKCLAK